MLEVVRFSAGAVERATTDKGERKLRGVASVFYDGSAGTEYALTPDGSLVERIDRKAFDGLLGGDVIACFQHDPNQIVGRTPDTLRLWTSQRGLEYEVSLPNTTTANDLWENVQRGIVTGSSFRAMLNTADASAIEWQRDKDRDVMIVKRFDVLRDVSPVVQPAYSGTGVEAVKRSLEQHNARIATLAQIALWKSIASA